MDSIAKADPEIIKHRLEYLRNELVRLQIQLEESRRPDRQDSQHQSPDSHQQPHPVLNLELPSFLSSANSYHSSARPNVVGECPPMGWYEPLFETNNVSLKCESGSLSSTIRDSVRESGNSCVNLPSDEVQNLLNKVQEALNSQVENCEDEDPLSESAIHANNMSVETQLLHIVESVLCEQEGFTCLASTSTEPSMDKWANESKPQAHSNHCSAQSMSASNLNGFVRLKFLGPSPDSTFFESVPVSHGHEISRVKLPATFRQLPKIPDAPKIEYETLIMEEETIDERTLGPIMAKYATGKSNPIVDASNDCRSKKNEETLLYGSAAGDTNLSLSSLDYLRKHGLMPNETFEAASIEPLKPQNFAKNYRTPGRHLGRVRSDDENLDQYVRILDVDRIRGLPKLT